MSEPTAPTAPTGSTGKKSSWKYTLALIALILAGGAGYYFYVKSQNPLPPPPDELVGLKEYLTRVSTGQKLADGYTDANKDLVADPPDEAERIKIGKEIAFTVVGTDNREKAMGEWKDFMLALEKATGKTVVYAEDVQTIDAQYAALRDGRLHVTAFNTGAVSTAVNAAGFVPLFAPADKDNVFAIQMEILVRKDSPAQTPADLKGKTVGFVALSSNSGAKAPMVALKDKFGLVPVRDYKYAITGGHKQSVKELIAGKHDAVCVASDLLREAEAAGEWDKGAYRSLYTSESFPPLCFGVPHHLPTDLREKIAKAFTDFKFENTSVGKKMLPQGKTKFAPVDYAKDWAYVREIDDKLTHLLDK